MYLAIVHVVVVGQPEVAMAGARLVRAAGIYLLYSGSESWRRSSQTWALRNSNHRSWEQKISKYISRNVASLGSHVAEFKLGQSLWGGDHQFRRKRRWRWDMVGTLSSSMSRIKYSWSNRFGEETVEKMVNWAIEHVPGEQITTAEPDSRKYT